MVTFIEKMEKQREDELDELDELEERNLVEGIKRILSRYLYLERMIPKMKSSEETPCELLAHTVWANDYRYRCLRARRNREMSRLIGERKVSSQLRNWLHQWA